MPNPDAMIGADVMVMSWGIPEGFRPATFPIAGTVADSGCEGTPAGRADRAIVEKEGRSWKTAENRGYTKPSRTALLTAPATLFTCSFW
jgi:hypothetical protein